MKKPIFTVFVRENHFTRHQLDQNPEFTINIPYGDYDKKILGICGTKSGRDTDKIKELNLTSSYHGANKDFHTAYYGKIVRAYIIE